jgi:hypothetical protein
LEFIVDVLFFTVCGWLGHVGVKLLTFGKINLSWGKGSESVAAEWIGFALLLLIAGLTAWICKNYL